MIGTERASSTGIASSCPRAETRVSRGFRRRRAFRRAPARSSSKAAQVRRTSARSHVKRLLADRDARSERARRRSASLRAFTAIAKARPTVRGPAARSASWARRTPASSRLQRGRRKAYLPAAWPNRGSLLDDLQPIARSTLSSIPERPVTLDESAHRGSRRQPPRRPTPPPASHSSSCLG